MSVGHAAIGAAATAVHADHAATANKDAGNCGRKTTTVGPHRQQAHRERTGKSRANWFFGALCLALNSVLAGASAPSVAPALSSQVQDRAPNRREVTLVARNHQFIPNRIEVTQDDLVRITFTSEGRATSFALDAYRILKRAGKDQTIVFEFRADQAGTFPFYCSLTSDPECRDMSGILVVVQK